MEKPKGSRRCTSTTFRLARGRLDGTSRPRSDSDSYEAPSVGRLDCAVIRTRSARQGISTTNKLRLVRPRVESLDPSYPPTLSQKSEHLMRLPTTSYHHGYNRDRRRDNANVSSHFLLPILGWKVITCHCTHPTAYCSTTDHPRVRIRQGPYPTISGIRPYPSDLDPASTRPRRPPPVSREERSTWHRTQGLFTASSPTSSRCPGMASHS
jgi:hypothetical protein